MGAPPDKRQRLVAAAMDIFYRRGFASTSLAQIAEQADVPLGNVYYYFKSKGALLQAVLDRHVDDVQALIDTAQQEPTPCQRLVAMLSLMADGADLLARYGCPRASLAQEIQKEGGLSDCATGRPFELQRGWMQQQFEELGYSETEAADDALEILCNTQGAALVAHASCDADVMRRRLDAITSRVRQLCADAPA